MRILIWLVMLAALGIGGAVLLAGPGTRFGLWEYPTAFDIYGHLAAPKDIVGPIKLSPVFTAAGLSLIGGLSAFFIGRIGLGVLAILVAIIAGASGFVPIKMRELAQANPVIHDITTDFENPPAIVAGANSERANPPEYVGDEMAPRPEALTVAEAQRQAFPDIGPVAVSRSPAETANIVRGIIEDMKMHVLNDSTNSEGGVIEATYTSMWFGFIDDFVVRLTPDGEGTRVDIRSKSRVGSSDLGANAKRVREFTQRLKEAAS